MDQEDRSFVVIVLGSLVSVVAYYAHVSTGPEAALIPILIGIVLALIVWNNFVRLNYIVATLVVATVEIVGTLALISIFFNVPIL